ncbi:MAG: phosphopantothenoylcysteine decarboxylase, partial [Candidatus Marinimicrobia bacterium]|nr:phosphopantothenoylcysteine decarboxylase [Candidatus Neomarinimicrobiota bacterium]
NKDIQSIKLKKSIDIMGSTIAKHQGVKIAFSLETENGKKNAINKMKSKGSDYIILNYANEEGAGFNEDTNHIYLFSKNGGSKEFEKNTKYKIAKQLIEYIYKNEK